MTVIYATVTDAIGTGLKNEFVHVSLVSASMWNATGKYRVSRVASRQTNNAGYVEFDLPPNSTYADTGTFYKFEHGGTVDYFTVPDTGGPYSVFNRLRDPTPESTKFKVTPYLRELLDATGAASATDGQTLGYSDATKTWGPVTRVTMQQLADGLAPKATTAAMNTADTALQGRATSLEGRATSLESGLATKASSATVSGIDGRVTTNTTDVTDLKRRVSNIEGGGTGGGAAPLHSGLRGLATDPSTGNVTDDHPQYLNQARGDARYYPRADAQSTFALLKHAARHAKGGADEITPLSILAADRAHGLADHGVDAAQLIIPRIDVSAAAATDANPSHASLHAKVGTVWRGGGDVRSIRQPIVHDFDVDITDTVVQNNTVFFSWNFTTREYCDLWLQLLAFGYYASSDPPNGATAQVQVNASIVDRDNNNAVVWRQDSIDSWEVHVGYGAFRPIGRCHITVKANGVPLEAKRNLQLRLSGVKDPVANANLMAIAVRGGITEAVCVGSF